MAYESRIYIVDVHHLGEAKSGPVIYAERIAAFDLSAMGYSNGWKELFSKPVDYSIYAEDGDTKITEDRYGERLGCADLGKVIDWLEAAEKRNHYRRIPPALGLLKGFDTSQWGNLQVVHFGY